MRASHARCVVEQPARRRDDACCDEDRERDVCVAGGELAEERGRGRERGDEREEDRGADAVAEEPPDRGQSGEPDREATEHDDVRREAVEQLEWKSVKRGQEQRILEMESRVRGRGEDVRIGRAERGDGAGLHAPHRPAVVLGERLDEEEGEPRTGSRLPEGQERVAVARPSKSDRARERVLREDPRSESPRGDAYASAGRARRRRSGAASPAMLSREPSVARVAATMPTQAMPASGATPRTEEGRVSVETSPIAARTPRPASVSTATTIRTAARGSRRPPDDADVLPDGHAARGRRGTP